MNITDDFRDNLNHYLSKRGHGSRAMLANYLGVSPAYITQLANGERRPNLERIEQIANYFGIAPATMVRRR